ncbi:MAG: hypothetical protein NXI19_04705 [Alphaproteobacteria bacterium]|nr:hypothetical protein [Alphaproteobacteria bacterium]
MTDRFEFELVYALPAGEHDAFELSDAVFEAGYHDAIIGSGDPRLLAVELEAIGEDPEAVILAAARAILKNLPEGTKLREVRPDLVSLADVAQRLEVKRQSLQQRTMPPAVASGLYRISEVADVIAAIAQPGLGGRRARMNFERANGWLRAGKAATALNAKIALHQLNAESLEEEKRA